MAWNEVTSQGNSEDLDNILAATNDPTGFENLTDSVLSKDAATRTISIAPAVSNFVFLSAGTKYTKSSSESVVFTDTEGWWYVYYSSSGALRVVTEQSNTGNTNEWVSTTLIDSMSSGQDLVAINPTLSAYLHLHFYNLDGTSSITVTAVLAMR